MIETEIIEINEAVQFEFEIKDVFSMHQHWKNGQVFNTLSHPKINHAFVYFKNGSAKYTDSKGVTFCAKQGDVVFIPFGATYKTEFLCNNAEMDAILINFNLYLNGVQFTFNDKISVLQQIVEQGNTVVVIEHNLDVLKSVDWLIDMGPEGGSGGGRIMTEGTPEEVAECKESFTGQFLAEIL